MAELIVKSCMCVCVLTSVAQIKTAAGGDLWSCMGIRTHIPEIPTPWDVHPDIPCEKLLYPKNPPNPRTFPLREFHPDIPMKN